MKAGITLEELYNRTHYYREVTRYVWSKYKKLIPGYVNREYLKYALDHIYSVYDGVLNKVPAKILCHPCNLRVITWKHNSQKGPNSDITLKNLLIKIKRFNALHKIQLPEYLSTYNKYITLL